jgi:hypothetical protein
LDSDVVTECGDEIDAKVKAAPSVAIGFFENAEDLESPDHVLYGQPEPSEVAITRSLIVSERVMLAGLLWGPSERMLVVNALIARVGEEFSLRVDGGLRLSQESKIVRRPSAGGNAEDLSGERMDQELQF